MLGAHVVYHTNKDHHATTVVGKDGEGKDITVAGSVHHRDLRDFAGLVTRVHSSGKKGEADSYDIVIFPPGKDPTHVEGVSEGKGGHQVEILG